MWRDGARKIHERYPQICDFKVASTANDANTVTDWGATGGLVACQDVVGPEE